MYVFRMMKNTQPLKSIAMRPSMSSRYGSLAPFYELTRRNVVRWCAFMCERGSTYLKKHIIEHPSSKEFGYSVSAAACAD